jgi:hypothetical protein
MVIKECKDNVILYGVFLLIFSIGMFVNSSSIKVVVHDFYESLMASNPGFSSISNLTENGVNYNESSLYKAKKIFGKIDDIIAFKLKESQKLPQVDIIIDFLDYKKILADRRLAITRGYLKNPTIVKAKIQFMGDMYKAKVRLKGDLGDHWLGKSRMSLRVKLKKGRSILGFRSFSIQKPRARQHPYDSSFQEIIRRAGGMSPAHLNSFVTVNGKSWGVMDIEEHISKEFTEKQQRKDSLIFRFSNDEKWLSKMSLPSVNSKLYDDYRLSDPRFFSKLYRESKHLKLKNNRKKYTYILNSKLNNKSSTLYDKDKHIVSFLISLIWNSMHTLYDNNLRYYLNPYTLLLEPITTDQASFSLHRKPLMQTLEGYKIPENYKNSMKLISSKGELSYYINQAIAAFLDMDQIFEKYQKDFPLDEKKNLNILKKNIIFIKDGKREIFQWIQKLNTRKVYDNSDATQVDSSNELKTFTKLIHARHYENGEISFFNLTNNEVIIKDLFVDGLKTKYSNIRIPGHDKSYTPFVVQTSIRGIYDGRIKIKSNLTSVNISSTSILGPTLLNNVKNPLLGEKNDTASLPFLEVTKEGGKILQGDWIVEQPIIIEGELTIDKGTRLKFLKESYLIVKGGVAFHGTKDSPIVLEGLKDSWKGLYILSKNNKSTFSNVLIKGVTGVSDGILNLTGGINIYNGDVYIDNMSIQKSTSEDALNIVNSKIDINRLHIESARSDGFDCDYCSGSIKKSNFSEIGGDALDFSGSKVELDDLIIEKVKDKGVSVGESSTVFIRNTYIGDIGVGIASKDGSKAYISNTHIDKYKLHGVMTYIKKSFYDSPTYLELSGSVVGGNSPYMRQKNTKLIVNGKVVDSLEINVKKMYNSGVMKK